MLALALGRAALALAFLLQLLLLFLRETLVLDAFAARVRAADPALHAATIRSKCWLLRHVLPAPRFTGSLVEPRLYVGSLEDAHALGWLEERRVRSVLTAASEPPPSALPKEDVSALQLEIGGGSAADLRTGLRHALPFMHDALGRRGGRGVLVHSCGGNGRACAVAAAFLMQARGMKLDAALAQLRATRPRALASPIAAAVWIPTLREYEAELWERGLLDPSPRPGAA